MGGVSDFTGEGIARNVAFSLSTLLEDTDVPWWRVVGKQGEHGILKTGGGRRMEQRELLEAEGVVFDDNDRSSSAIISATHRRPQHWPPKHYKLGAHPESFGVGSPSGRG